MRPKGAPHIQNVRFWELSDHSLRFIAKDAFTAERANPDGPKALTYLDEINDACTVMGWRHDFPFTRLETTEGTGFHDTNG